MTLEIAAVMAILAAALVLFVSERLRMDVVALLVLAVLTLSGLVTPDVALSGFSNPAVITVWAMFILSAGLSATGVADVIGRQVHRLAGSSEPRMILTIMLTTGVLSAFMNNIGVAALMLPVVMDIARRSKTSPSRLLMPMAYGSLLGGLTTLVGTPPNLVASDALRQAGFEGFSLFEFAPIGVPALVVGALFVAFIGRHLLPREMPEALRESMREAGTKMRFAHDLEARRFQLRVGTDSPFHGRALAETGLAGLLGLNVYAVRRSGEMLTELDGSFAIRSGDTLHVQGRVDEMNEFFHWRAFETAGGSEIDERLALQKMALVTAAVAESSNLVGLTVRESDFRRRFHSHVLEIQREDKVYRDDLSGFRFAAGDRLRLELKTDRLEELQANAEFTGVELLAEESLGGIHTPSEALLELDIPEDSHLAGLSVAESGIWEALRLRIVGIARRSEVIALPDSDERFRPGDKLLVLGTSESLELIRGLQSLELVATANDDVDLLAKGDTGYTEVTLSPQSSLVGKTLKEVDFRRRYGLQVQSIWRRGRAYRSHLRNMRLEFGDALLLFGRRERIESLAGDQDFLILTRTAYEPPARKTPVRALLSAGIMLGVIGLVLAGYLPIAAAAVSGAAFMIASRCLSIEGAYRAIEWKSVFLIACMIPLGSAMQTTGAAEWLARGVAAATEPFGPWGMIAGLYLITALATTIVPTAALVVIMASIGIDAAGRFGIPPQMIVMAVAMAASASFTSPISHPANVLVMGPGGYRFADYVKQGILLAAVVMLAVLPMIFLMADSWEKEAKAPPAASEKNDAEARLERDPIDSDAPWTGAIQRTAVLESNANPLPPKH